MKISASIYSNKNIALTLLIQELDKCFIDFFHVDCLDDVGVFEDIKEIRKISKTPIDLHIITDNPEKFYPYLKETPVEFVTFQYENLPFNFTFDSFFYLNLPTKLGLALVSYTEIEVFKKFNQVVDFILFMTTTPGKSGGVFNRDNFKKIRQFQQKYPQKKVHVDGGVNAEISFILRNMGVYSAVSGSFLVANESIPLAMLELKSNHSNSSIEIKDFMIGREDTPTVPYNKSSVLPLASNIHLFKIGMTIIVNEEDIVIGIATNADIRKALLRYEDKFYLYSKEDVINKNFFFVYEDETISEMMSKIKMTNFPISYLPVLKRDGKLAGCLTFSNLIKGEL